MRVGCGVRRVSEGLERQRVEQEPARRGRPAKHPVTRRQRSGRRSYAGRASMYYFASEEEKQRAVNAYRVRGGAAGYESMSDLVADLVMTWVAEQESEANGGQPFVVDGRRRGGSS